jgi:predicted ATPase
LQTAHELGEQLLRLAHSIQDTALLAEAHRTLGEPLLWLGELVPARAYLEQGILLYDSQRHRSHDLLYGLTPGVTCPYFVAQVLWLLGYPDQALQRSREALTLARELSSPLNLSVARAFAAWLHQFRREAQATQEQTEADLIPSTEQGFALQLAMGLIHGGWALAELGRREEGIAQMHQGLTAYRATGAELVQPYYLALLAETYGKVGRTKEGLAALAEALTLVDKTGERFYEAELYRLEGELTLQSSRPGMQSNEEEAEACFLKAIDIARRQQAKSLELRAVVSLSRLWQQQGKQQEAHAMLAAIYNWFTEGFDTKDLQEAQALLEELA